MIKKIILTSCLFISTICFSQNNYGIVEYGIAEVNVPLKEGNSQNEMVKNIINTAKTQEFELKFKGKISSFTNKESLDIEQDETLSKLAKIAYTTSDSFYLDLDKKILLKKNEENILIKEQSKDYGWEISTESKKIDQYMCYKATCSISYISRVGKKEKIITAWFAPSLPYSFGPKQYFGLPGLILELTESYTTYIAKKIILNDKEIAIDFPKGKTVTNEEYEQKVLSGN